MSCADVSSKLASLIQELVSKFNLAIGSNNESLAATPLVKLWWWFPIVTSSDKYSNKTFGNKDKAPIASFATCLGIKDEDFVNLRAKIGKTVWVKRMEKKLKLQLHLAQESDHYWVRIGDDFLDKIHTPRDQVRGSWKCPPWVGPILGLMPIVGVDHITKLDNKKKRGTVSRKEIGDSKKRRPNKAGDRIKPPSQRKTTIHTLGDGSVITLPNHLKVVSKTAESNRAAKTQDTIKDLHLALQVKDMQLIQKETANQNALAMNAGSEGVRSSHSRSLS